MDFLLLAAAVALASFGFIAGRLRAEQFSFSGDIHPNSRPNAHGYFVLMWSLVPVVLVALGYVFFSEGTSR
ncbi:MAG TPA: phosphate ABC transporter permease subunit PstC, partial [Hyphomonas adhaerens]|nr:phosphate ABC transporter permease subunit PstC [Hyphomonas adhaerens]